MTNTPPTPKLNPNERIDGIAKSNLKIIQSPEVFSFGIDAVLLANFPHLPKRGLLVDFCAGNGAVGLLASSMTQAQIVEVEIQERLADMAERSIQLNGLEERMSVVNDNLSNSLKHLKTSSADLIFCNPPYFKIEEDSKLNDSKHYSLARHELTTNLDEIFNSARQILKTNARIALVHRPSRFLEIIDKLREYNFAPKRIQFVYPKEGQAANLLLIDAIKDGKPGGEIFLPPLIVHNEDGTYTNDILKIYE